MDDNAPKENPPADFNKLDLSQLQGFSFGTQWTQEKPSAPERRDREGGERPRREDRRDGPGGSGLDRRDRRTFRRPAGPSGGEGGGGQGAPAGGTVGAGGGERREFSGGRPRREGGGGDYRGGPRQGGGYAGGQRYQHGGHGGHGRGQQERGPYDSPYYGVTFYPEDTSFNTLVQTIRKSCRTVELFEIARTVVAKTDRFVVVVAHKPQGGSDASAGRPAPAESGGVTESAPAPAAAKPPKPLFHVSVPDGIPFESDEGAVAHVLSKHLDKFFGTAEVEVDPPKGNFQVINKCGITGELLGPPNYHRYNQIVQQHYAAKVAARMGFEAFRSRIETIRDPEVVNQWLAKMKKTMRYTWKFGAGPAKAAPAPTVTEAAAVVPDPAPAPADAPSDAAAAAPPDAAAPDVATPAPVAAAISTTPTFDTLEDARVYLLTQARDKVVRTTETARFHGRVAETMAPGEIRHAIEGALERQRRFPLDTANALRGRLRREHFTIFKKGSKGVSYVCAVKRKFRVPGQTFADSIGALISFIEANPMVRASELAPKLLGISIVPPPRPVEPAASAPVGGETPVAAPATAEVPKPETNLSLDERAKVSRLQGDLMWLVREGYVTEFIDGRLFAPPPTVEARKKEIENEEHDPENFPEAPPSPEAPAPAGESEPSMPAAPAEAPPASEAATSVVEANGPAGAATPASAETNEPVAEGSASGEMAGGHSTSEPAPAQEEPVRSQDSPPDKAPDEAPAAAEASPEEKKV
ncbi:MAG: hypothetical protein ACREH8_16845 [Opitutaceae bacterium]